MGKANPAEQWTMNFCPAGIGIHFPEHRKQTLAIGEKLGVYRDYPVSKGCTPPFAPIWIAEMVKRRVWGSRMVRVGATDRDMAFSKLSRSNELFCHKASRRVMVAANSGLSISSFRSSTR